MQYELSNIFEEHLSFYMYVSRNIRPRISAVHQPFYISICTENIDRQEILTLEIVFWSSMLLKPAQMISSPNIFVKESALGEADKPITELFQLLPLVLTLPGEQYSQYSESCLPFAGLVRVY